MMSVSVSVNVNVNVNDEMHVKKWYLSSLCRLQTWEHEYHFDGQYVAFYC